MHHIAAIAEAPSPKDAAALRSFLRLILWFSKFYRIMQQQWVLLRMLSKLTLNGLMRLKKVLKLKSLLTSSSALAMFH